MTVLMEWIDAQEKLPPQNQEVLINTYRGDLDWESVCLGFRMGASWYYSEPETKIDKSTVTHWMPKPDTFRMMSKVVES